MNMEVCERSSCVHGYHIYKDIWTQLLAKNSSVKESPIQTEAIGMQSLLGLITSHLLCKYYEPVLGNEVTCLVIACGSTISRQQTIRVWKF